MQASTLPIRAMRLAARQGFNPYDSFPAYAAAAAAIIRKAPARYARECRDPYPFHRARGASGAGVEQ